MLAHFRRIANDVEPGDGCAAGGGPKVVADIRRVVVWPALLAQQAVNLCRSAPETHGVDAAHFAALLVAEDF